MLSEWIIKWEARAAKEIHSLPEKDQKKVIRAVESLRVNPYSGKALKGKWKGLRRLTIGNYSVIYTLKNKELLILVLRVGHRREIYR